jgi:hypothetical protein
MKKVTHPTPYTSVQFALPELEEAGSESESLLGYSAV